MQCGLYRWIGIQVLSGTRLSQADEKFEFEFFFKENYYTKH